MERIKQYAPLAAVMALGAALFSYNIAEWSFWFDESFTSALVKYDYVDVAARTANDVHPPLYYLLLKAWSGVFGSTDAGLRSLSAVLMFVASLSLYPVIKRMTNRRMATVGVFFAVIGPFTVRYAQEARMYALAAALLGLATWALQTQMARNRKKRSLRLWLAYAVLISAALYTHYFTFPIIIAHWLFVIYSDTKLDINRQLNYKKLKKQIFKLDPKWLKANALAALLFLPWLPTFVAQLGRVNSGFWIEGVKHTTFMDTLTQLFTFESFSMHQSPARVTFGVLFTLGLIACMVNLWKKIERKEKANLLLTAGPAVLTSLVLFVYSAMPFTSSVYFVRYFASFSVLLYGSMAYVSWLIYKYWSKHLSVALTVALGCLMLAGTGQVTAGWSRDYAMAKDGITQLNTVVSKDDAVVAYGYWQQYDTYHYLNEEVVPQVIIGGQFFGGDSLLVDRGDLTIDSYDEVMPESGVIWFVTGDDSSQLDGVPETWVLQDTFYHERDFKITRYRLVN